MLLRRVRWVCLLAPLLALVGCGPSTLGPIAFQPKYVSEAAAFEAVPACARYNRLGAVDVRNDKKIVGVRYLERSPAERFDIAMATDPTETLSTAARAAFRTALLEHSDSSNIDIQLSLASIQIEEKTYSLSSYVVNVVLDVQVLDSGTRNVLWTKRKSGHGENRGQAGNEVNYQEALSRGFDSVFAALLKDPEFSASLCPKADAAPASADSAVPQRP